MSLLESALNQALREAIDTIVGIPGFAIAAQQNVPRPTTTYASVHIVSIVPIGWEDVVLQDEQDPGVDIEATYISYRDVFYSVDFYLANSMDFAMQVQDGLIRQEITDYFASINLGLGIRSDVRDLSSIEAAGWEDRAQFDVTLNAVGTNTEIIRAIEQLTISGELQPFGNGSPINTEVTFQ